MSLLRRMRTTSTNKQPTPSSVISATGEGEKMTHRTRPTLPNSPLLAQIIQFRIQERPPRRIPKLHRVPPSRQKPAAHEERESDEDRGDADDTDYDADHGACGEA